MKVFKYLIVFLFNTMLFLQIMIACPTCGESIKEVPGLGESLSASIIAMSILPFVLVGSFIGSIYFKWKSQQPKLKFN